MSETTGTYSTTARVLVNGETVLSSNDLWFRYLESVANLFLAGEIDLHELMHLRSQADDERHEPRGDAAATGLAYAIDLSWMEPSCVCIANWDGPPCIRNCEPLNRRQRLAELMGVPFIEPLAAAAGEGE